jgi:flagellar hook-associated protein 2
MANAGLASDLTDIGQNVDGTLTTASGTLNIGAYASSEDGRQVKVSDFAVIGGEEAEVRGLQFEVLGGVIGARGSVTYAQGFASLIEETVNNLFDGDAGLVSQRIESLNNKNDRYDEKATDIDARYEKMLFKYQVQFSVLQSIIASSEQTRDYLTATFSNSN